MTLGVGCEVIFSTPPTNTRSYRPAPTAETAWKNAHDDKEHAANAAADKIDDSLSHGSLNDSWWDNFSDWASGVLSVIKAICDFTASNIARVAR